MSRTYNTTPKGKIFRTPKTTQAKRELSFRDNSLLDLGIKPKSVSVYTFVSNYDDKEIASLKNKRNKRV
jgi:hypothetical protein